LIPKTFRHLLSWIFILIDISIVCDNFHRLPLVMFYSKMTVLRHIRLCSMYFLIEKWTYIHIIILPGVSHVIWMTPKLFSFQGVLLIFFLPDFSDWFRNFPPYVALDPRSSAYPEPSFSQVTAAWPTRLKGRHWYQFKRTFFILHLLHVEWSVMIDDVTGSYRVGGIKDFVTAVLKHYF
jgi:hypothetical protein